MPALEIPRHHDGRPSLGHVNLMVDTFIANATADDLRSIARNILATGPPGIAAVFSNAARQRLRQTSTKAYPCPHPLFLSDSPEQSAVPSPQLHQTLMKARSMYGAGLGFASLDLLTSVARATIGLRWEDDSDMAQTLALIDSDISQAIQVSYVAYSNIPASKQAT
ncbi:hypothetical protein D9613_002421 [Agrocybe pediades]|uniref:Uncharacterized protein n=1 Tax=Agrocybe pediades TaxID=84607 RepID=A0A8H4VVE0_9AGAR|nr:hypothetical protein D9613_002421 [Agrocybe pediades]